MYNVNVYVTYKDSVLDPQGQAVQSALERLDFTGISHVRIGKFFEMRVAGENETSVAAKVEAICDRLLANPNMEQYRYELQIVEAVK